MAPNDGDHHGRGAARSDAGPSVRPMSAELRAQSRDVLLAEIHATRAGGVAEESRADAVTLGRDGLDDAPPPLKKRWIVVGAGLVAAAAAVAIVASTGLVSGEDLGLTPADSTPTQEKTSPEEDLNADRAVAKCRATLQEKQIEDSTTGLDIPPALGDADVVYMHTTADHVAVAVSDSGTEALCAYNAAGDERTAFTEERLTGPLRQDVLLPEGPGIRVNLLFAGRVAPQVTQVEVHSDRGDPTQVHVQDGFFSAWVPVELDENLDFVATLRDGSTEAQPVDFGGPPAGTTASRCFEELGIELPVPESDEDPGGAGGTGGYRFVAEHENSRYIFGAATDGEKVQACAAAPAAVRTTWGAAQPSAMPDGSLIVPFEPEPERTDTGPYPVIGRAAPEVTSVVVIRADGKRTETYLRGGFYSEMLPATEATGLTYVVTTQDGETTTVGSD